MSSTNSKVSKIQKYRAMIAGVQTNVGTKTTIPVDGVQTSKTAIVNALQAFIDAAANVANAQAAYEQAVVAQKAAAASANTTYLDVKTYAQSTYKNQASTLGTFGLAEPTRRKPDAATVAAAVQKREATRKARGTAGPRQKAKITGATPAVAPAAASSGSATTTKS
jgi:hypothetical protein